MEKRLVQLPDGQYVVVDALGHRIYKTFMVVGSRYTCDKNCPYCTAKITLWPGGNNHWEQMASQIERCERAGIRFEYLTMSGNGEPSKNPIGELRELRDVFDRFPHLFEYRRFQTSGNIFWNPEIFALFGHDHVFEITRVSLDSAEDMQGLCYNRDYTQAPAFQEARVVFNHCLLKANYHRLLEDIDAYIQRYGRVLHSLNLKILNTNTFDETQLSSRYSQWILDTGLGKGDVDMVVAVMNNHFERVNDYNPFFDRFEWRHPSGMLITLYARRTPYGLPNIVFYRGALVDYSLHPQHIELPEDVDLKALFNAAPEVARVRT
ncbi:hypothetical protein CO174_00590 [Candidatus Uhrbacteria bacterium CG_4_9_14_3_um_filter_50_9]|uniref:Radical SAM core domain-containing protein n=1 Tax=Candidatus Uhrbacteria bacterium CG_4_9_14_3_um_filter_50_9 TaxID=1975035 RepID=A0A2M7XE99_9BACT|nr:MAG: hypothetical protein CO174_00590 [Candidatus Uhrbacteria bacterium CG_4_9_14_3_um_filter_50_9]